MTKLYFTKEVSAPDSYTHIRDMNLCDILCDDYESEEIVVDNFLNQFPYNILGQVLNKIVGKLRLNGEIAIIECDIDFIAHNLTVGKITQQEFNEIVFSGGPASCLFSMETIVELLNQAGLKITEKLFDENQTSIIKAQRC